jgi:uncharacterized 2Fe-2S/4Fe-4S cluster protein (DUF4445 family)
MPKSLLILQPEGKRLKATVGKAILEIAQEAGVDIQSVCAGKGICGKCRVIVRTGSEFLSQASKVERTVFSDDEVKKGYRLACRAIIVKSGTITVEVPSESRAGLQRLLVSGVETSVEFEPSVRKYLVEVGRPTLMEPRSDVDRLLDSLSVQGERRIERICLDALRRIPHAVRSGERKVTVTVWENKEVISVEAGDKQTKLYGFAVDVGTTKLAGYLVDLDLGTTVAAASSMNPQIPYGEDVISRISFVMKDPKGLSQLQALIIKEINKLIFEACKRAHVTPGQVHEVTVVGNTAMHHIFFGIYPGYVALAPYPTVLRSSIDVKAKDLGIDINPCGNVHGLPVIAGFVGADAVADILATQMHASDDVAMMIDIGTNTEIVVGDRNKLTACSCASGPAFEGAHIKNGMRAATGAIERVYIDPDTFKIGYETVDNAKPSGVCGSGVVDAVAEMLKRRVIDSSGKIKTKLGLPNISVKNGIPELVLAGPSETASGHEIVVTQEDIRQIQLAKAAIFSGISVLMRQLEITTRDISKIFFAGAFGTYVDPQSARVIGMYPDVPLSRVQFVGNAAGSGARMALMSLKMRRKAGEISEKVHYIELGADANFQNEFLNATFLPHKNLELFPSVKRLLED